MCRVHFLHGGHGHMDHTSQDRSRPPVSTLELSHLLSLAPSLATQKAGVSSGSPDRESAGTPRKRGRQAGGKFSIFSEFGRRGGVNTGADADARDLRCPRACGSHGGTPHTAPNYSLHWSHTHMAHQFSSIVNRALQASPSRRSAPPYSRQNSHKPASPRTAAHWAPCPCATSL